MVNAGGFGRRYCGVRRVEVSDDCQYRWNSVGVFIANYLHPRALFRQEYFDTAWDYGRFHDTFLDHAGNLYVSAEGGNICIDGCVNPAFILCLCSFTLTFHADSLLSKWFL